MVWPFPGLQREHYRVVITDPPWHFKLRSEVNLTKAPQGQYACMSLEELARLPVHELAHPGGCSLVMWTTAPFLGAAMDLMVKWGYAYKTAGAWAKLSVTGQHWQMGTGYTYRSAAEFWLVGTRGLPKANSKSVRNLIVQPVREHSRKPDEMLIRCEQLWDGPYCELFSRSSRPGWDAWGLETGKFDERSEN